MALLVAMKSGMLNKLPCEMRWPSKMSVWPYHACTDMAAFTWVLACWSEQAAVFSDMHPVMTKKNSYSWPSISDFSLITAPVWMQEGSAPSPWSRIQQHPCCSSALAFTALCFGQANIYLVQLISFLQRALYTFHICTRTDSFYRIWDTS